MDQIKTFFRDLSLRKSIVLYITAFTVLALFLSAVTFTLCHAAENKIRESYPSDGERYYLTNLSGEQLGEGVMISDTPIHISPVDEKKLIVLNIISTFCVPVYTAGCILSASLLFYQNKIKKPVALLTEASEKISGRDLDFSITPMGKDELGQLCITFDRMREALASHYQELWRQMEERKRLNAAFAHDLRTPLTVLKGYAEMMQGSKEPGTKETAQIMAKHLIRMEQYIDSMSQIRRLEDVSPEYQEINIREFLLNMEQTAKMVAERHHKELIFHIQVYSKKMRVDPDFISQVYENLLANAVRFAKNKIITKYQETEKGLSCLVKDDGPGFTPEGLRNAAQPYYTGEADRNQHFGLGLYICRLLCEHHGGSLKINSTEKGAEITVEFLIAVDKK